MRVTTRQIFFTGMLAQLAGAWILAAMAQTAPAPRLDAVPATEPPAAAPAQPQPLQPPRRSNPPGLFGAFGRWFDDSVDTMTSGWNATVGSLGDQANDAAKGARDAASSVVRVPTTIVTGHQRCAITASGGPDCVAAIETLCRQKGYTAGTSLHIQSEQKCPVWGWVAGKQPAGQCGTATYVTSAMCR